MCKDYVSSIPSNSATSVVSEYRCETSADGHSHSIWLRVVEHSVNGVVVGTREYDEEDRLIGERPLKSGKKHGIEYTWYDNGQLELAEPYCDGRIHGTAKQWDEDGRLIGTYTLRHGTGFDIWRNLREDGTPYVAEIQTYRDGFFDGFTWWFNEDRSVWWEWHWRQGAQHGIERQWNDHERLARGWPKYWIDGNQVDKRRYVRAVRRDSSLPPFRDADQAPLRALPRDLQELL